MLHKDDIAERIALRTNLPRVTVLRVLDMSERVITDALTEKDHILFTGFLKFEPTLREAGTRRNPRTGETIEVPAKMVVRVKPMATLKAAMADVRP